MSGKATIKHFKTMLAEAQLPEKVVQICLRGDLAADFEQLENDLSDAQKVAEQVNSLSGGETAAQIAEQMEALRIEMQEHTYPFRCRALPKRAFRALVADHPPRSVAGTGDEVKVHDDDRGFGVNVTTFFDALIRACVVDPELDAADWKLLLDEKLTDNQFDTLAVTCWYVNRSDVDIPFSYAASKITRSSAAA